MSHTRFLKERLLVVLACVLVLSACQQAQAPSTQVVEVVKTVEVTKLVQGEKVVSMSK